MKNKNKGIISLAIIIILVLVIGGSGFYFYKNMYRECAIPTPKEIYEKIPIAPSLDSMQTPDLALNKQEVCEKEGGMWTPGEPEYGGGRCIKVYADAGKKCTNSNQCLGDCVTNIISNLGKEGTCEKSNNRGACFNPIENERFECLLGDIKVSCDEKRWDSEWCDSLLKDKYFFR